MALRKLAITALFFLWGCSASMDGIYHTVEKGETLYRISRAYGVDERYLARLNGIDDPMRVEVGQLIYIPGADRLRSVSTAASAPRVLGPQAAIPSSGPVRSTSIPTLPTPKPVPPAVPPSVPAKKAPAKITVKPTLKDLPRPSVPAGPAAVAAKGKFAWPVRGQVVRKFGTDGLETCKGLEIATPLGTPVLSAAAGKVTYSGDGIRGYGNLIILKHEESYYTVYAFNQKNLVTSGTFVGKGERIALSGLSPGGGEGRLHFEIRKGKTAVNPIFYLP